MKDKNEGKPAIGIVNTQFKAGDICTDSGHFESFCHKARVEVNRGDKFPPCPQCMTLGQHVTWKRISQAG